MKVTRISQHAHQLTRFRFFNSYLVEESDGFTLIDTGFKGAARQIADVARSLAAPIRRIALTHAHGDHVGSVDELVAINGGLEIAASGRSVSLLRRPPDTTHPAGEPAGQIKGSLPGLRTRVTRELEDGDHLGSLLAIATPGHIPGHLSFLDERDGTLFAGDALTCVGRLCVPGYSPWYFPMPNLFTWNKIIALESARSLQGKSIKQFASGHGKVRCGGLPELAESIRRAEADSL